MKINFQTACGLIAKEQGYTTWEELLADNEAHTHYYQLAADLYSEQFNQTTPINMMPHCINEYVKYCYNQSFQAGWHSNPRETGTCLMLIVSEIAEAMEGDRKDIMDDHLPTRKMFEVELADAVIRIFDLAGREMLDLGGAITDKLNYNLQRADHKLENRNKKGGKKY